MNSLRKLGRDLVNVIFYLMIAVLILTGIRQYILQPFQVDGHSMGQPSIMESICCSFLVLRLIALM